MIADKIIPSFYVIEVRGKATRSLFSGDYGIDKVAFGTLDFSSDMHATAAADTAVSFLLDAVDASAEAKTELLLNPEFFPGAPITVDQKKSIEEVQDAADEINATLMGQNKIAIPITKSFDPMGDFVMSRKKITGSDYSIDLRIIANIDHYIKLKTNDEYQKLENQTQLKKSNNSLRIH